MKRCIYFQVRGADRKIFSDDLFGTINFVDIVTIICEYLSDYDKLQFLLVSKNNFNHIKNIYFRDLVCIDKVYGLWYYNNITNILCDKFMKFPLCITHLTFEWNFNQDIKSAIPESVTHLTFGFKFNQDITSAIPTSMTHLTFGNNFNQDIKSAIPESV